MTPKAYAAAAAIAGLLLTGCEQRQSPSQTSMTQPPVQMSAASGTSTADPSLPPAESAATSKPDQDAAVTLYSSAQPNPAPAAETGNKTADSTLTPVERDREMPMKGQANDYSTPDRAKEGDQPNTASKEPGGQEASAGNLTGNTKEVNP